MTDCFVTPSGLLIDVDFQLIVKIVDHFVDLKPKNWAILAAFYVGEFDFTKISILASSVRDAALHCHRPILKPLDCSSFIEATL